MGRSTRRIDMPEDYFGEGIAERYDEGAVNMSKPEVVGPVVDFLADLAGDGPALEFGIGTGTVPLHGPTCEEVQ